MVLLHDPESGVGNKSEGNIHKRKMPHFGEHPITKGVENLFSRSTLEKAQRECLGFIDVVPSYTMMERGKEVPVPESWSVNDDEKRNLCDWLCDKGTREGFRHFERVFEILEQIDIPLEADPP